MQWIDRLRNAHNVYKKYRFAMRFIEVILSAASICILGSVETVSAAESYPSLAIARTFSVSDVDLLPGSFSVWDDFPPCRIESTLKVDLFLVYSRSLNESIPARSSIETVKRNLSNNDIWKNCFSTVIGIGVDIDPMVDLYQLDQQHSNPLWVNGPNRQFERTIRAVQNATSGPYDFLYLMEMDSIPVQPFWLDVIEEEVLDESKEFTILGSKYRGDKWDPFFDQLPWSLINHINGNAIYNLSHPLLELMVRQLESEAGTVANSIPYDYRIAQIIEEVQTGLVPSFFLASKDGKEHRLSPSLVHSMGQFDLNALVRETLVIGNYASTQMIPSYLTQHEVVIHGANMLASWNSTKLGNVSLAISDWNPLNSEVILASLDTSHHPFTTASVVVPDNTIHPPRTALSSVDVHFASRSGNPDSADLCTVPIRTSWFVMTNSYHELKEDVQIMTHFDHGEHKPIIAFMQPDFESCYAYVGCQRDLQLAQEILPGFDSIYQDFDFVFHTASRNDYCRFLRESSDSAWSDYPSATSYAAFLQKHGLLDHLYVKSDRRVYGSSRMFLPLLDSDSSASPALRMRQLQNPNNDTNDRDVGPDHGYICSSQRTVDQCLGLNECNWRETQHSCYVKPNNIPIGVQRSEEEEEDQADPSRPAWVAIISAVLIVCGSAAVISLLVVGGRRVHGESRRSAQAEHDASLIPLAAEESRADDGGDSRVGGHSLESRSTIDSDPLQLLADRHFEETDHGVELVNE